MAADLERIRGARISGALLAEIAASTDSFPTVRSQREHAERWQREIRVTFLALLGA